MGRRAAGRHRNGKSEKAQDLGVPTGSTGGTGEWTARTAGFGRRTCAFILDIFALSVFDLLIFGLLVVCELAGFIKVMEKGYQALGISLVALDCLYFILLWWYGRTIGQSALQILVVRKSGERLSLSRSFIRFIFFLVSLAPLGLGLMPAAFGAKRGLHDLIAGSMVIRDEGHFDRHVLDAAVREVSAEQASKVTAPKPPVQPTPTPPPAQSQPAPEEPAVPIELDKVPSDKRVAAKISMETFTAEPPILTSESETVELDLPANLGTEIDEGAGGQATGDPKTRRSQAAPKSGFLGSLFKRKGGRAGDEKGRSEIKVFTKTASSERTGTNGKVPEPTKGPAPGSVFKPKSYSDDYLDDLLFYKNAAKKEPDDKSD